MMKKLAFLAVAALLLPSAPVVAGPGDAQGRARQDVRAGRILQIRDIENAVLPTMGGAQYLGFEYDPVAMAYRLKFIQGGHVIFVDVDARTGQTLRRTR